MITLNELRIAVESLGLSGRPLCVHASLKSFGWVDGGANTIVDGLLLESCTVLVPTFSYSFMVPPPLDQCPLRNGWDYQTHAVSTAGIGRIYSPRTNEFDREYMGAVPAAVLFRPGRVRGTHPLNSFAALGPLADELLAGQTADDVYAPLRALAERGGAIVLMGVDLTRMTFIHLAEQVAGRTMFRRWANGPDGRTIMVAAGGCSEGFGKLKPILTPLLRERRVGDSHWRVYPACETLETASEAIRANPFLTHCGLRICERCNDAVLGGPELSGTNLD
jgi:aminoglycoside 3-N-acetyltransferase